MATPATTWQKERATIASLSRTKEADDPQIVAARQRLRAIRLEEHILEQVRAWPPLTPEQLSRLGQIIGNAPHATAGAVE